MNAEVMRQFLAARTVDLPLDADYIAMKAYVCRNLPTNNYKGWTPDQLVQALGLQLSPQEYNRLKERADAHQRAPLFYKRYNLQWAWRQLYSMSSEEVNI